MRRFSVACYYHVNVHAEVCGNFIGYFTRFSVTRPLDLINRSSSGWPVRSRGMLSQNGDISFIAFKPLFAVVGTNDCSISPVIPC